MKNLNKCLYVFLFVFYTGLSFQVNAASISGYAYGEFTHPVVGCRDIASINNADLGHSSSSSSVFNWGTARRSPYGSQFRFDGVASDAYEADFSIVSGNTFSLGEFTYTNLPTYNSRNVRGVDFRINVNLTNIGWSSFDYSLSIDNTPNNGTNEADYVRLTGTPSDVFFEYEGQSYLFEMLGFTRNNGETFEDYTFADENSSTSAEVYARVQAVQAVPVPAAVWLFISGGLGLVSLAKRARKI